MPLADKWRAFGWEVREIDGHDMGQIIDALDALPFHAQKPSALIAHTVKGKGVSFAEDTYLWHSMVEMAVRASRTLESEGIGVRVLNHAHHQAARSRGHPEGGG